MSRDVASSIFVIICSIIVYFNDEHVAKFVDPMLSIVSCLCLLILSYPYMKESSLILLQTIPASVNIDSLRARLLEAFPNQILNVHDLHIWQLTASKIVSTAHIIFKDPSEYVRITEDILTVFHDQGITQVTIQPEFKQGSCTESRAECLMQCPGAACKSNRCCGENENNADLASVVSSSPRHRHKTVNLKESTSSLTSIQIENSVKTVAIQPALDDATVAPSTEYTNKETINLPENEPPCDSENTDDTHLHAADKINTVVEPVSLPNIPVQTS